MSQDLLAVRQVIGVTMLKKPTCCRQEKCKRIAGYLWQVELREQYEKKVKLSRSVVTKNVDSVSKKKMVSKLDQSLPRQVKFYKVLAALVLLRVNNSKGCSVEQKKLKRRFKLRWVGEKLLGRELTQVLNETKAKNKGRNKGKTCLP